MMLAASLLPLSFCSASAGRSAALYRTVLQTLSRLRALYATVFAALFAIRLALPTAL
jgi:hypothetical protein